MRAQFVECRTRKQAYNACPWACVVAKVIDGYHCFESWDDYFTWRKQK